MSFSLKIIIIDDDKNQCQTLADIFQHQGYFVEMSHSGREAKVLFAEKSYDLAIVDIRLGDMTGPELVEECIQRSPTTEVIYITGHASLETALSAVQQKQVVAYEVKPVQMERVLSYARQIAQRRQVEGGLYLSERRFRKITAMSPVGIYETDSHGYLTYVNECWCQMAGVASQYALGKSFTYGVAASDVELFKNAWDTMLAGKERKLRFEFRGDLHRDDTVFWGYDEVQPIFDQSGKLTSFVGIRVDVTRQKEQTRSLRIRSNELEKMVEERTAHLQKALVEKDSAKQSFDTLFQNIPDGIISVDREMRIREMNAVRFQGLSPELEIGQKIDPQKNLFQADLFSALKHTLTTRQSIKEMRVEFQSESHEKKTLMFNTSVMYHRNGTISGGLLIVRDISQLADLEDIVYAEQTFKAIIGQSLLMKKVVKMIDLLADKDTTVLVTGESGTGKELLVETLHELSDRNQAPLVTVNCSALPENLLESELFGHVAGAFTGAARNRIGRIEAAEGGILFLDEIGDLSPLMQLKLLRFIETKEYERLGESKTRKADVRIVTATNADLQEKVQDSSFREDFYYRLKVMKIDIPPLRQRIEDIPLLIEHFIRYFSQHFHKDISSISQEAIHSCLRYRWPGNVRELKHAIEHACILTTKPNIGVELLPSEVWESGKFSHSLPVVSFEAQGPEVTGSAGVSADKEKLLAVLRKTDWNIAKAARLLGIGRTTIYQRMKAYQIARHQ